MGVEGVGAGRGRFSEVRTTRERGQRSRRIKARFMQGTEERGSRDHKCQTSSVKVQGLRAKGQVSQRARIPRGGVP